MSIGKLEFKLPEERQEFNIACKASTYVAALSNVRNMLRNHHKYGCYDGEKYELIDEIYTEFFDICEGCFDD